MFEKIDAQLWVMCLNDLKEPVHENHLLTWIIWLHYIHNVLIISIHNQGYYS